MRKEEARLERTEVRSDQAGAERAWQLGLPARILERIPDRASLIRLPLMPQPSVLEP